MRFAHEFRFTYSIIGLTFLISGLVDALVEDFTVKFLVIGGICILMWWVSLYEMIYYPTPDNPLLESVMLMVAFLCGMFGIHSLVWLIVSGMLGRKIGEWVWIAPGYYMPKSVFVPTAISMTILYLVILYIVNTQTTEKRKIN